VTAGAPVEAQAPAAESDGLSGALRRTWERWKAGDVGSMPVIVGLIIITIFFTAKSSVFFTAVNFDNLTVQAAGTIITAIGVVFVLLIGEIDLSIGFVGGVAGVLVAQFQQPGTSYDIGAGAIVLALLVGAAIGATQGSIVAYVGVPSFVVTLAGYLVWQGVILRILGNQGVIGIQNGVINGIATYFLNKKILDVPGRDVAWGLAALITVGYAIGVGGGYWRRRRAGLPTGSVVLVLGRVLLVGAISFGVVAIANHSRGLAFVLILVVVLVAFWSYVAGRTTFGRHVYAVGGNAEAARRAGINVPRIKVFVFMISSSMAALGGIVFASRLNSVDLTAGSGTILLDAISAAVIGGTSLFGGRGKVTSALFGGLIIATVANGIDLLGYTDAIKDIVTGLILLAAVTLDTVARRRLAAAGR
jgi:D-xylose transport system permease protein